ncbi:MAG: hypothetical protein H8E37_04260 [Planctomycetes bacterium]|nr:hypothetical protein [Planctomycetota bacterium]
MKTTEIQMVPRWLLVGLVGVLASHAAQAEGLLQSLPKTEAWTTFELRVSHRGRDDPDENARFTFLIGERFQRKGESFRRFELTLIPTSTEKPDTATVRGVVAEKSLRKTHSLTNVLRELVVSAAGNTIRRSELDSRARMVLPRRFRPLVLIALNQSGFYRDDGKLTESGSATARDLEFQRGRLTSKPGTLSDLLYTQDVPLVDDGQEKAVPFEWRSRQTVWPSEMVPFGVAALKLEESWSINSELQGKRLTEFTIVDFGTGPKPSKKPGSK